LRDVFKRYAERIDNATLRERVLLFAAAALIVIFVVNATLIQPLRDTQRRLGADIAQKEAELRTIQGGLQRMMQAQRVDPDARNRERIAQLQLEVNSLEASIAEEQRRFTPPQRMRQVLEEMLERGKRLQVLDMKTLPASDLSATQGQSGRRVFRHGMEITLAGSYLDLYAYLHGLEALPTQLYWGRAEMSVAEYPVATLKLTVYTLSFDQAWLVV
jgi:MSHA biogenesis protein MshJ